MEKNSTKFNSGKNKRKKKDNLKPGFMKMLSWHAAYPVLKCAMYLKYGYKIKPLKMDEPYILMSNHVTEDDCCFSRISVKDHFYFVVGEHLYRNPFMRGLLEVVHHPIPLAKGSIAADATMDMFKRMKAGYSLCIYPEGARTADGRTNPIADSTAKLIKKSGLALVTMHFTGGYFTHPRWAKTQRRGKVTGEFKHILSSEEVKKMSLDEINTLLHEDIYEDAYETQDKLKIRYRGSRLSEGLENFLFFCPNCKDFLSINTKGNKVFCSSCNSASIYDEYGYLNGDFKFNKVSLWSDFNKEEFDRFYEKEPIYLTLNEAKLFLVDTKSHKAKKVAEGGLSFNKEFIRIRNYTFPYVKMEATDYMSRGNSFLFSIDGKYYHLKGNPLYAVLIRNLYLKAKEKEGKKFDIAK